MYCCDMQQFVFFDRLIIKTIKLFLIRTRTGVQVMFQICSDYII